MKYEELRNKIENLEDLLTLPLTFYDDIYLAIQNFGHQTFVEYPVKCWQTSGYTGEPKKFYFSKNDVDEIAKEGLLKSWPIP